MKILSYAVLVGVMLSLSGCDDAMNKPKTEIRTMISILTQLNELYHIMK